jgi:hypothetical protein
MGCKNRFLSGKESSAGATSNKIYHQKIFFESICKCNRFDMLPYGVKKN